MSRQSCLRLACSFLFLPIEVDRMKEAYEKSLILIKENKIRTEKEYMKLAKEHFLLSSTTLKLLSNKKTFQDVIKYAKNREV